MRLLRLLVVLFAAIALQAAAAEEPAAAAAGEPAGIEPEFVRPLVPIARGRNDSNPVWSPSGDMIAFERSRGDDKDIVVVRSNGAIVQTIHHQNSVVPGQGQSFFPGVLEPPSSTSGFSCSQDGKRIAVMSTG